PGPGTRPRPSWRYRARGVDAVARRPTGCRTSLLGAPLPHHGDQQHEPGGRSTLSSTSPSTDPAPPTRHPGGSRSTGGNMFKKKSTRFAALGAAGLVLVATGATVATAVDDNIYAPYARGAVAVNDDGTIAVSKGVDSVTR